MALPYYFAYGSNMLPQRLLSRKVILLGQGQVACAEGYQLVFNKKSDDGSAKANLVPEPKSKAWGVVFTVDPGSLDDLDGAEGAPNHYQRATIAVRSGETELKALTYLAHHDKVLPTPGQPYDWYLALILAGAQACGGLPRQWVQDLRQTVNPKPDLKQPPRTTFTEAVAQLKVAGHVQWQDLLIPKDHPRPSAPSVVKPAPLITQPSTT